MSLAPFADDYYCSVRSEGLIRREGGGEGGRSKLIETRVQSLECTVRSRVILV